MEIKTKYNIGDLVEAHDSQFGYRGYIDSINISIEKDKIYVWYHFDGCSFNEEDISLVDRGKDAIEIETLKKRLIEVRELRMLHPEDISLVSEDLEIDSRLTFLTEC